MARELNSVCWGSGCRVLGFRDLNRCSEFGFRVCGFTPSAFLVVAFDIKLYGKESLDFGLNFGRMLSLISPDGTTRGLRQP